MFMITIIEIDNDKGNRNIYFSKHFLQRNMFYLIGKEFTFNLFGLNSPPLAAKNINFVHGTKQIYT